MTDEKQINNTKNQRRDNYCIRIQKALQYKGNCDHEDLPSILVAFEKEIKNELLPENAVVLTKEEYDELLKGVKTTSYTAMFDNAQAQRIIDLEMRLVQARKETAREIIKWFRENSVCIPSDEEINELAKQYGVEVEE